MKNKALNLNYKLLIILSILSVLPACSSSDDDDDASNSAPSVSAGEDQTVNQGATVDLVGVASDSDGSISSWLWQQTSGSPSVSIQNSTTSNAYFSAPTVDTETTLVFELEVKDNDGASVSDSMRVTVRGPGDSVNPLPNDFEAVAGDGQVTLTWSHYSSATDYNIYRSSASDCELANYTSCADGDLFTSKSSGFVDDDLTNGTTYYYWIEAILEGVTYLDGAIESAISAIPAVDEDDDNGFNINEDDYQTIYTHSDGTIYAVTKETMNWDDARAMAQEQGGDLVTIHSEEENSIVADLVDDELIWLGASDDGDRIEGAFETHYSDSEDGWRWIDSREFTYYNWGSNEPNDLGGEDCLRTHSSEFGKWNDVDCTVSYIAVFEFSPNAINEEDYQEIYTHSDGTIYAITKESMNWDDARSMAQEQGGDLVTIHSEEENSIVADLVGDELVWLGASDDGDRIEGAFETHYSDSEDGWRWVDGRDLTYYNWGSNEPNDLGGEDCLRTHSSEFGKWNDVDCTVNYIAVFKFTSKNLSNGLVAHYEFEGNADDSSDNGNDGEEYGGVSYADGIIGQAANFDGVDSQIRSYASAAPNISVCLWINSVDSSSMLRKGTYYDWIFKFAEDNKLSFTAYNDGTSEHLYSFKTVNSMPTSEWVHICLVYNSGDDGSIYFNAIDQETEVVDSISGTLTSTSDYIRIGNWELGSIKETYQGMIDDLRIYNRALNSAEIQTLYELGDD